MDNAQKAIMIGVGLFITIIIISAVLLIVNLGTGLVDDATSELGTMSSSLQNQILQSYDNKLLTGVQVRSAIQQYLRATDMTVVLGSDASTIAATVGAKKITKIQVGDKAEFFEIAADDYVDQDENVHQSSMNEFNKIANAGKGIYINTSSNYQSYVLKVKGTDTIVGIVFVPSTVKISASEDDTPVIMQYQAE